MSFFAGSSSFSSIRIERKPIQSRTGGGNRVLRIIADVIQRTGDVELYGIEIQECRLFDDGQNNGPVRLPCRKLGFTADDRRVASPALIPALSERYFTIGKTAPNERRSSTGSGGNIPGTAPSARLGIGGQTGSILRAEGQQDVSRLDDRARPRLAAYPARRANCRCFLDHSGCCLMPRATG
jgi:hypothetical protein